ncbi:hypothetical protein [Brevundimonas sp. SL130]|uniref:hypothetical protein n=1 Tax=Brevundimonas sp. SL130 TaxID=2995143 RepID=UPI00226D2D08|nr:hypothetical protein [Brevundimonas sp. SL130]WAC59101.1 hypothetical protein OU998_12870 [Brevundimonas sp. SL130]
MSDPKDPVDPFPTQAHPPVSPFPPLDPPSDWIDTADAHDLPTRENTLVALGRFAFPPAPALDEEGEASRARRWTSQTLFVACAFLMIFNAGSVQNWARQQPPSWSQSTVDRLATVWVEQLDLLGANLPVEGLHETWRGLQATRFDGRQDEKT